MIGVTGANSVCFAISKEASVCLYITSEMVGDVPYALTDSLKEMSFEVNVKPSIAPLNILSALLSLQQLLQYVR